MATARPCAVDADAPVATPARPASATPRLGLRARITLAFALGAALLSALLAGTTWALTRENLLNQREAAATRQAYLNAQLMQRPAPRADDDTEPLLDAAQLARRRAALARRCIQRRRSALVLGRAPRVRPATRCPPSLRSVVDDGQAGPHALRLDGEPELRSASRCPTSGRAVLRGRVARPRPQSTLESLAVSLFGAVARHHARRRRARLVGQPADPAPAGRRRRGRRGHRRRPARHPPRARPTTPTSTCSSRRSTTWPRPSRSASSATAGSRPTSATSCARRS